MPRKNEVRPGSRNVFDRAGLVMCEEEAETSYEIK